MEPAGHDDALDAALRDATSRRTGRTDLWDAVVETTRGGKLLRPRLLLSTYDALAGPAPRELRDVATRVAVALELLHTAFLAHDDVIDDDTVRRGRPNVAGVHAARALDSGAGADDAQRYGATAGILAGDLALAGAYRETALSGAGPDVCERLLDLLDETLRITAEGELADVRLSLDHGADLNTVLRTAERKTAVYTFQLPLRAGALLAGREDLDEPLSRLGRAFGLAFQLRDDLDGVFGDPVVTGKSNTSDLREGKTTALVAFARSTAAWPGIAAALGSPDASPEELAAARGLLESCGARAAVERLADDLERTAAGIARDLGLDLLLPAGEPAVERAA